MYVYAQEIGRAVVCSEVKTFFLGVDMRNLVSYLKKKKRRKMKKIHEYGHWGTSKTEEKHYRTLMNRNKRQKLPENSLISSYRTWSKIHSQPVEGFLADSFSNLDFISTP